jgi:hypothetical protein
MIVEREVFERILESEAKVGAERIYASLVKTTEISQAAVVNEGEESVKKRRNKNG